MYKDDSGGLPRCGLVVEVKELEMGFYRFPGRGLVTSLRVQNLPRKGMINDDAL